MKLEEQILLQVFANLTTRQPEAQRYALQWTALHRRPLWLFAKMVLGSLQLA